MSSDPEGTRLATIIDQARRVVGTLADLKGAAMKAGQILSLEASDLLPKEVLDILRELHDNTPGMSFEAVAGILKKELGADRLAQLSDLSHEPIAAASIGQVHAARLDGKDVVVKVQFPGVAESIDADLGVLKKLAQTVLIMQGKSIKLDSLFAELARGLKAEVDYRREAEALVTYQEAFAGDDRYVIPTVYLGMSTKRVLTLSRVTGVRLQDWIAQKPSPAERSIFASTILDLVVREFFDVGLVQTDPNYGNFLWQPDERRLVLLDFGAVQRYSKAFRQQHRRLLRLAIAGDRDGVIAQALKMELMDPRERYDVQALFSDLMMLVVKMFAEDQQPFDFADLVHLEEIRRTAFNFVREVKHSPPPRQIAFLNRKLGGMYHLLKEVGARVDLTPFLKHVLSAEGR